MRPAAGGLLARALRSRRVRLGLAAVLLLYLIALLAPLLAPYNPTAQLDLVHGRLLGPSWAHPLGTDLYGRDLLSRLLYGARLSLWIAGLAVVVAITVGTAVGPAAGLAGRVGAGGAGGTGGVGGGKAVAPRAVGSPAAV